MGRLAIIIVLGLALTVGIIGYTLNSSKSGVVENVSGFSRYTTARNIAHTGVNMALRALDRNDSVFLASRKLAANVMGGRIAVTFSYPNPLKLDTMDMVSVSKFMDTSYVMKLRLRRTPIPFPVINEAVGLRTPDAEFKMSGAPARIDGRDHDVLGNLILPSPSPNDKPGVGVLNPADTLEVQGYGSQIDGTTDVVVDSGMSDPALYVNEYINAADLVFTTGTYGSNMVWGSPSAPWIVYCNGDVKFTGNIEGWGLLVVSGNLTISGTFSFHGLVIAYKEVAIDVQLSTGTPNIIGALLMAGPAGSKFEMKGNDKIYYSSEAVEMAKFINKLQVYRVVRWYE